MQYFFKYSQYAKINNKFNVYGYENNFPFFVQDILPEDRHTHFFSSLSLLEEPCKIHYKDLEMHFEALLCYSNDHNYDKVAFS